MIDGGPNLSPGATPFPRRCARFFAFAFGLISCPIATIGHPQLAGGSCPSEQIHAIKLSFEQQMRLKDLRVLNLYTPVASFTNPDGTRTAGPKALLRLFLQVFRTFDSDLHLRDGTLSEPRKGACIEAGRFTERLRDRGSGKILRTRGRYRFLYVRSSNNQLRFASMEWRQVRSGPQRSAKSTRYSLRYDAEASDRKYHGGQGGI